MAPYPPVFCMQDVRQGAANQKKYHSLMRKLLADVKARAAKGELLESSVAAHLLRIRSAICYQPMYLSSSFVCQVSVSEVATLLSSEFTVTLDEL